MLKCSECSEVWKVWLSVVSVVKSGGVSPGGAKYGKVRWTLVEYDNMCAVWLVGCLHSSLHCSHHTPEQHPISVTAP